MSIKAMNWAWEQDPGSPSRKLILMAMADHADDEGRCHPSRKALAEKVSMSKATVTRALEDLEELGLIRRERQLREDGSYRSNNYYLSLDGVVSECNHVVSECDGGGITGDTGVVSTVTPHEPPDEPSDEINSQFEEFWTKYPHPQNRGSKQTAFKKYKLARKSGVDPGKLLKAVDCFTSYCEANAWYSPAMAQRWLGEARWESLEGASEPKRFEEPAGGWDRAVRRWLEDPGTWSGLWGPPPDDPETLVPQNLRPAA